MNGIYVEKPATKGNDIWVVRDSKTHEALAFGSTIIEAVDNYETVLENSKMAKILGASYDDMDIA